MKDSILKILNNKVVGAKLSVYSQGKTWQYNYGMSSLNHKKEVEDNTIFRLASISKVIIAIAALKLVETEKLNLEQDISQILGFNIRNPKHPKHIITSKMLMLHTSSILDGYEDENLDHDGIEKGYNGVNGKHYFVDLKDLLLNINSPYYTDKTFADDSPGSVFHYSNFGSGILACIIEKCSGRLFTEYVESEIFKPLKMDANFKANRIIQKELISDTFYYDEPTKSFKTMMEAKDFINFSYPNFLLGNNFRGPAGGAYMSLVDLNKIMQVLLHDGVFNGVRILNKETVDYMLQMHYLGPNVDYMAKGLQLKFIDYFDDCILKGHTGLAYGIRSFMFFSKALDFGVLFIFNGGIYKEFTPDLNDIQYDVLKTVFKTYAHPNKMIATIDSNNHVDLGGRSVILNTYKIINNKLYLSLIDVANVLDVIPKVTKEGTYIKDLKIEENDGLIDLEVLLDKLLIGYEKNELSYKIYLS